MKNTKFRAWDEENKCFWYSDTNNGQEYCECVIKSNRLVFKYGVYAPFQANGEVIDDTREEEFEAMFKDVNEFTNRTDKNGKEIYDGDIVSIPIGSDPKFTTIHNYVISYYVDSFCWTSTKSKYKKNYLNQEILGVPKRANHKDWFQCEVIGNIYENPELLN